MRLVRLIPPLVAGALLGCQDATGIDAFTGAYGLSAVDGRALPGLVGATLNCDMLLTDGLLDVSTRSYAISMTVVQDCARAGGDTSIVLMAWVGGANTSRDTLMLADTVTGRVFYLSATRSGNTLVLNLPADGGYILTPHSLTFTPQPFINREH